ncbi:MAG: adenylyl-sulfate kinase, partial [Gammaproteobacteria bacterium]|nr:adenylyl-sulfate kinase [Gammaproteobacteria bacterium]
MKTHVLWFTGLSGSGKSTIADNLIRELKNRKTNVLLIDGDSVRSSSHKHLKFTPQDIRENNNLIALHCKENIGKHDVIIVSVISPFRSSRDEARALLSPNFAEVFIKTDLKECIKRDVKG